MALLDGKYEVISQQELGDHLTLFHATDHDGQLLVIEWFELTPEQEHLFEQHRRLLKRWQREKRGTLIDVVSRPGARYTVWPHSKSGKSIAAGEAFQELRAAGYAPNDIALERNSDGEIVLTGLHFHGVESPVPAPVQTAEPIANKSLSDTNLAWIVAGAATLLAAALAVVTFFIYTVDFTVAVPAGEERMVQDVLDDIYELGLGALPLGVESSARPGTVVNLNPPAGAELRPNRAVQVSYAVPAGQQAHAVVPNLVGNDYATEARAQLQAANWPVGDIARITSMQPSGTVLAQVPSANASAAGNTPISLLVSSGPPEELTVLPPLVGLPREEAINIARLAGFPDERIVVEEAPGDARTRGRVLSQSLTPHRPVAPNVVTLRLLVASGGVEYTPVGLTVPDFVGLSEAALEVHAIGWPRSLEVMSTRDLPEGVIMQTPEPRTEVSDITHVVMVVNRHPVLLPTPNVMAEIRSIGLRRVAYAWNIEPGILGARAEVWAETVEGQRYLVTTASVFGGSQLRGTWPTLTPGPVRFELYLNDEPYGDVLMVPED